MELSPPMLRGCMNIERSRDRIVHSPLDVNAWLAQMPSVDEARPARCPGCDAPSRPVGGRLGLIGHGLRTRQLRGPPTPGQPPVTNELDVRRYQCQSCNALITVVPRGVMPRRHFSKTAIALALALYGIAKKSLRQTRRLISPWTTVGDAACTGWAALTRWIRAVRRGSMFVCVRAIPPDMSARQAAERAATTLAAWAPPALGHLPLIEQAFAGAQAA
jgi:hypothetical protein